MARSLIRTPAGARAVGPLIAPLMPASSTPARTASGALVYQLPGPSSTLPPAPALPRAVLTAAVSVAPVVSPEGIRAMLDGIVPPFRPSTLNHYCRFTFMRRGWHGTGSREMVLHRPRCGGVPGPGAR